MTLIRGQAQPAGTATWINSAIEVELSGAEQSLAKTLSQNKLDDFWVVGPGDVPC
jgi:hypothetical protein